MPTLTERPFTTPPTWQAESFCISVNTPHCHQRQVYREMPDHAIPLTERGHEMARTAGVKLREAMEEVYGTPEAMGHCRMWVSPFRRTRETALGVLQEAGAWVSDVDQSPYLVEQVSGDQHSDPVPLS